MKRMLAALMILALAISLCACGKAKEEISVSESESVSESASVSAAPQSSTEESKASSVVPDKLNEKKYACVVSSWDGLTLRTGPGAEYDAITVIPDEAALTELANQRGWVYVDYGGEQGWVFGQYLVYTE